MSPDVQLGRRSYPPVQTLQQLSRRYEALLSQVADCVRLSAWSLPTPLLTPACHFLQRPSAPPPRSRSTPSSPCWQQAALKRQCLSTARPAHSPEPRCSFAERSRFSEALSLLSLRPFELHPPCKRLINVDCIEGPRVRQGSKKWERCHGKGVTKIGTRRRREKNDCVCIG